MTWILILVETLLVIIVTNFNDKIKDYDYVTWIAFKEDRKNMGHGLIL